MSKTMSRKLVKALRTSWEVRGMAARRRGNARLTTMQVRIAEHATAAALLDCAYALEIVLNGGVVPTAMTTKLTTEKEKTDA